MTHQTEPLYRALALRLVQLDNLQNGTAGEANTYEHLCLAAIDKLAADHLPQGSGFDDGCTIDLDASSPDRIVINAAYHHMDDHGSYDGWSEHQAIVKPSLAFGFDVRVTGRDRNDIKDYITYTIGEALSVQVDPYPRTEAHSDGTGAGSADDGTGEPAMR